jgi:hypothetical protein
MRSVAAKAILHRNPPMMLAKIAITVSVFIFFSLSYCFFIRHTPDDENKVEEKGFYCKKIFNMTAVKNFGISHTWRFRLQTAVSMCSQWVFF